LSVGRAHGPVLAKHGRDKKRKWKEHVHKLLNLASCVWTLLSRRRSWHCSSVQELGTIGHHLSTISPGLLGLWNLVKVGWKREMRFHDPFWLFFDSVAEQTLPWQKLLVIKRFRSRESRTTGRRTIWRLFVKYGQRKLYTDWPWTAF
jgi:hypothetical protein